MKERKLNKVRFCLTAVFGTVIAVGLIPMMLEKTSIALTSLSSTISRDENADGNNNEIYIYKDDADEKVYVYTDPETGVQYLIFRGYRKAGMTPRLDKNGNVMVQETTQETTQETSETSTEISETSEISSE